MVAADDPHRVRHRAFARVAHTQRRLDDGALHLGVQRPSGVRHAIDWAAPYSMGGDCARPCTRAGVSELVHTPGSDNPREHPGDDVRTPAFPGWKQA